MLETCIIAAAGIWAGAINAVVGSGTLVTFPTLVLLGYPPVVANMSNNLGMIAGGFSGTYGYRRELEGSKAAVTTMLPATVLGAVVGALLLLILPSVAFNTIVPLLISTGLAMVLIGPSVQKSIARRHLELAPKDTPQTGNKVTLLRVGAFGVAVYGGYFGAAQGILLVGLMGIFLEEGLQRLTALKNVFTTVVNVVAALTFMLFAWERIDWHIAGLIGVSTFFGGYLGAKFGRRLPSRILRSIVIVVGVIAILKILLFG